MTFKAFMDDAYKVFPKSRFDLEAGLHEIWVDDEGDGKIYIPVMNFGSPPRKITSWAGDCVDVFPQNISDSKDFCLRVWNEFSPYTGQRLVKKYSLSIILRGDIKHTMNVSKNEVAFWKNSELTSVIKHGTFPAQRVLDVTNFMRDFVAYYRQGLIESGVI